MINVKYVGNKREEIKTIKSISLYAKDCAYKYGIASERERGGIVSIRHSINVNERAKDVVSSSLKLKWNFNKLQIV